METRAPETLFAPNTDPLRKPLKHLVHAPALLVCLVAPLVRSGSGVGVGVGELLEAVVLRGGRCRREVLSFRVEVEWSVGRGVGPGRGESRVGEGGG